MLTNYDLKARARNRVKGPAFNVSIKLSIFLIIWQILSSVWDGKQAPVVSFAQTTMTFGESLQFLFRLFTTNMVGEIIFGVFGLGAMWAFVEWGRNKELPENPVADGFKFWGRSTIVDVVVLLGLRFLFTFLWTLVLIIPGIVKSFGYSQAPLIYAEDHKQGVEITNLSEYLLRSQELMAGYKLRWFWLQLSFIGWWILVALTFGLAAIYVVPYYNATMAEFYIELTRERRYGARATYTASTSDEDDEL